MIPPVGLYWLGNVVASRLLVPAKDCPWSWHSDGPHLGGPKREILSRAIQGEEINNNFWKILGHNVNHGGLGIPDPRLSEESSYNISKSANGELVESLLRGSNLNYVGHRACVRWAGMGAIKERKNVELVGLDRQKEILGGHERNRLHRATRNGAWISAVPHRLNCTELSQ